MFIFKSLLISFFHILLYQLKVKPLIEACQLLIVLDILVNLVEIDLDVIVDTTTVDDALFDRATSSIDRIIDLLLREQVVVFIGTSLPLLGDSPRLSPLLFVALLVIFIIRLILVLSLDNFLNTLC